MQTRNGDTENMKVALFEIYRRGVGVVSLRYVSDHLSIEDMEVLYRYIAELISDKKAMQPKTETQKT